jgi:ABC-type bacteriocin/lantibiotic exporter with double-glycine peptidase domain
MITKAKKTLVLQQDSSDCGVACLLSAIQYFNGTSNLEHLRKVSGTDGNGTTLLGLCEGAEKSGIAAEAFEAELEHLIAIDELCLLHVKLENELEHFVLCYGYDAEKRVFIIGDPANGVERWTEETLAKLWISNILLTLKPLKTFLSSKTKNKEKRRWFLEILNEDYNILIASAFLGIIIAGLGLSTAMFTQKLVDEIIPKSEVGKMVSGLVILLTLLIAKSLIGFLRQLFLLRQAKEFNERITGSFMAKLLYLPKVFFDSRKTGDLISRLNDTQRIQRSVAFLSGSFVIDFLVVIISSAYLFHYHYAIALTTLTAVPLMGLIAFKYKRKILNQNTEAMAAYAFNESNYIDVIQGISVVKVANKEDAFISRSTSYFSNFQSKNFALGKTSNQFNLMVEVFAAIIIVSIIAQISYFTLHKQLKIGEMMAILSIAISIIPSCTRLMLTNLQIQEAIVAFNRMYEFADTAPESEGEHLIEEGEWGNQFESLKIKDLSFRFAGRKQLLKAVNLEIQKGKITVLLGESGCGKSTLLQILQKFYVQEKGFVLVNGKFELKNISTKKWRDLIGVVPQEIKLFNCSLIENICLSQAENDFMKVYNLCKLYGMDTFFDQFPQGLATRVGEDGINLSGGQKQIVGLLRALFKTPQLLLLDEATAALDPKMEQTMLNLLLSLKNQMGILLITHKESTSLIADFKYVIEGLVASKVLVNESV